MKKTATVFLALALIAALLAGCGASSKSANDSANMDSAASTSASAPMVDGFYGGDAGETAESEEQEAAPSLTEGAKLIYTADINLETTEFDRAVDCLEELVTSSGGYFETSSLDNYSSYRYGSYVVRVPATQFAPFCDQVGELCQINGISRSAEDISEAYYDTESRLVTQQTKLERLQTLLSEAESMEDIITLESAISETELQIENLTGTLRRFDSLADYSTIQIDLAEVARLSELDQPAIGFGAQMAAALRSGTGSFVDGLQSFALWLARSWAGLLMVLLLVVAVCVIIRARRRPRRDEKALHCPTPPETPKDDEPNSNQ